MKVKYCVPTVIVCALLCACGSSTSTNNSKPAANSNATAAKTASPTPAAVKLDPSKTQFTVNELAAAFHAGLEPATDAYQFKTITVTGRVIQTQSGDEPLKLGTEPPGNDGVKDWEVIVEGLPSKDKPRISAMKIGDHITVKGVLNFANFGGVNLVKAELQ